MAPSPQNILPRKSSQISLDFDHIDEEGVRKLTVRLDEKLRMRGGPEIVPLGVTANNRKTRVNGYSVKHIEYLLMDGQKLKISVNSYGTVYQVRINGSVVPIKHVDDWADAVDEMASMIAGGSQAFTKRRNRAERRLTLASKEGKSGGTGGSKSRKKQKQELQDNLEKTQDELEEKKAELDARKKEITANETSLESAKAELKEQQEEGESLKGQIAEIQNRLKAEKVQ